MSPGIGIGIAPHEILQTMSVGPPPFRFDLDDLVFNPFMAKRIGQGPFAAAPIVQGYWDGTGVGDIIVIPRGDKIGNQTQLQYADIDPYQGAIVFCWTPEKDRDATQTNDEYLLDIDAAFYVRYEHDNQQLVFHVGGKTLVRAHTTVAGTTYYLVFRWDTTSTLDGMNYLSISMNDAHTFGSAGSPTVILPDGTIYMGSSGTTGKTANAILEGLTFYRRPLTDGTYGVRPQNGNQYSADEINAIWNAGAGRDPTLVTGSEDVCLCVPTDSQVEILDSGNGEAWSWPWESNLPDVWGMWDGGFPGTDRAVEFNATTTSIDCGSDVDIDDIADDEFTFEAWVRADSLGENNEGYIINKGDAGTSVGWHLQVHSTHGIVGEIECATTNARSRIGSNVIVDGKWHHVVMYFNDAGDRKIYFAIDGVWVASYSLQTAGVGAIVTDVAEDLWLGANSLNGNRTWDGAIAWAAISKNDRHTVGTDFVPPRAFPADDANYLASWPMDEGVGAAIDNIGNQGGAGSGAANRDGTLANGSWSSIWEQDATPVIPQSVEFFQENDGIDFGSGANIDDLPSADCTLEFWGRIPVGAPTNAEVFSKTADRNTGWSFYLSTDAVICRINHAGSDASVAFQNVRDGKWHHFAIDWDFGTLTARAMLDGVEVFNSTAVGAYIVEAVNNCIVNARFSVGTSDGELAIGWIRLSDNRRYTGNNFVPDARINPPANDGNAQLLVNMTDGTGVTATDTSGNGYNGTITFGATTRWNNTPDMEIDEPGAAIYGPKGYNLGVDAALEGMYIEQAVESEADYVVFPVLSIGESGRARPRIRIYDVSNAADIVIFNGPMLYGTHTGGNGSPDLIPTDPRWIADALIEGFVYNITDGSSAPISDNDGNIVIAGLGGGVDNDWDNGDVFVIRFPRGYCERPWMESFCWQVPTQCTLIRIYIENVNAEGVMQIHQVQVLPNLLLNGDHESLTGGNPDLITGWTNQGLGAGDTESSAGGDGIIHSGAEAMQWNAGASGNSMYYALAGATIGRFYATGIWSYGNGVSAFDFGASGLARGHVQYDPSVFQEETSEIVGWSQNFAVLVALSTAMFTRISSEAGASRYTDDMYLVALDDVPITVTPADWANSLESGGLRIDGRDWPDQPVANLRANAGWIWCNARPRHETGEALDFGQIREYIFDCFEDGNNYIRVWRTNNAVHLEYNANGAGAVTGFWNSTGLWNEDVDVEIWVQWGAFGAWLIIDGVNQIALPGPVIFATDFTGAVHWGHDWNGELQFDGVIS